MLYNIIMYVYQTGIAIYSHFNEKVKKMWTGERAAFGVLQKQVEPNAEYIWFHAASLGEFEQGRPLIERIKKEYPHYKILLTFFSPSGYEVRKNYEQADIVTYLPIDTVANARKFLRAVRPVMAFFIKYEFWYNYLHILRHRNVPVYSVSSIFRPNQIFFRPYGRQYAAVLKCFSHFFVQNDLSKKLLAKIGINDVTVVGDTRFDRVLQIKESSKCLPLLDKFIGNKEVKSAAGHSKALRQVFVAGSSWLPDEEIFIKYFDKHSEWKLIIAPHVIANSHLQQILQLLKGKKVVFYTKATEENVADADVLIIDCFGLLSSIYHYCDVAYVGGGFGVGIHNVLEAAVWSVPVMFGPNNKRFAEAQGLLASEGGFEVDNYEMFAQVMEKFSSDKAFLQYSGNAAGDFVKRLSGATDKVFSSIKL
ncbi:3-deoxy-D-manno-octulosonic acid transferase [Prevotella nigrescens]|uniref:3-deoxy-D-manno-octulosonic acid transferase n=1 Tax=Prevotella nigrescens TaxID=28133 RepID=UPI0002182D20|nr:glycosyltransferase N-terminal domain-containing protein [Prevotella nigrescens]EGQ15040.1 3-deoxy-manno-octulosonate cytidylyltransferase [Prevotella nigrescens ATCC 33563]UAK28312.1 3-deoxy-D-manno-octulosonic acid transferase [Prevotella nigrescens]WMS22591.1 glycosyltransferase N-terminal domain-containing protein [Prevotella nigrescens]SUB92972.1 3-deoxy-D-manno-octulosonic-acid transferase [Prevotella nigrescens]